MSITRPISIPISSFVRHGAEKSRGRKTTTVYEFIRRGTGKRSVRPTVGSGWDLAGTMVISCHAWVKKCTRGLFQKRLRSLGHGCTERRSQVTACVIRTKSELAGIPCLNLSCGRSRLGAMVYGKPTGHVLELLYEGWYDSRGPCAHPKSRYSHVWSPQSAQAGWGWGIDSTVVITDHD